MREQKILNDHQRVLKPNCWNCRYFAISWHPSMPYACRLMGFKSRVLPCVEVQTADQRPCQGFLAKSQFNEDEIVSNPKADMWLA